MSIAKFIECEVGDFSRGDFSLAQEAWKRTSVCDGFGGQLGGWDSTSSNAVILCFWQSRESVNHFMDVVHDDIASANNQVQFYKNCKVDYFTYLAGLPALVSNINKIGYLHIERKFKIIDTKLFIEDQLAQWNDSKLDSKGALGCSIWQNSSDESQAMLISYWSTEYAYNSYLQNAFSGIKTKLCPKLDTDVSLNYDVVTEKKWHVTPNLD